jgi:hypothetical protein
VLEKRTTVWVAMETSTGQVELELAPTVEIPTTWPEKAQWPRCLKRWPSPERVECIKVWVTRWGFIQYRAVSFADHIRGLLGAAVLMHAPPPTTTASLPSEMQVSYLKPLGKGWYVLKDSDLGRNNCHRGLSHPCSLSIPRCFLFSHDPIRSPCFDMHM